MTFRLAWVAAFVAFGISDTAWAQKRPRQPAPIDPPTAAKPEVDKPDTRRPREFSNTELSVVLRLLARQARINLIIADEVLSENSTLTTRLEDVTALEAIQAITSSKGLRLENRDNVYYVEMSPEERAKREAEGKKAKPADGMQKFFDQLADGLLGEPMTRAMTAQTERLLDWEADPANAARIAKARKALLDALLKEGFSREEAMRIVERHQLPWSLPIPGSK